MGALSMEMTKISPEKNSRRRCRAGDKFGGAQGESVGGAFRFYHDRFWGRRRWSVIVELMDLHHVDGGKVLRGTWCGELDGAVDVIVLGEVFAECLLVGGRRVVQPVGLAGG